MIQEFEKIPLLVIGGPTGVGKTAISILLAQQFNGEVINGDALQVYRGLDIGTGKIQPHEMAGIPHHLIDIKDPNQDFDAHQFKKAAQATIQAIHQKGKLAIVVGGSGLYLQGLIEDLSFGWQSSESRVSQESESISNESQSDKSLWQKLYQLDPKAAQKIPYQNRRRLVRALEVIQQSGKLFSEQAQAASLQETGYQTCLICLDRPRLELYERINQRVCAMVEDGLEKEVQQLYHACPKGDWPAIKAIGYKEWWPYFQGEQALEQVIEQIQQNSRRYAKRQLTWFRNRFKQVHWIDMTDELRAYQQACQIVTSHLRGGSL